MDDTTLNELIDFYDLAPDDPAALRELLLLGQDRPVALVNLMALGEDGGAELMRYSEVSGERMRAAGGEFVHQGLCTGSLWGGGSGYHVVVVGQYPNGDSVLSLLADPAYREAYAHRRAAVADQRVLVTAVLA